MADRITSIEEKIAYLEHHVETLDGLVRELFAERDRLQRELRGLREAMATRDDPGDEEA